MARLPLIGGSYSTRSIIASAQRCINYFPEINPKFALVPVTHYQRPGLVPIAEAGTGPIRQLYRASNSTIGNDNAYVVSGRQVFQINPDWSTTLLGDITPGLVNPVSIIDNGIQALVVDGSPNGWIWNITGTPAFQQLVDPTGLFVGADRVDYIDTFILFNIPGTIFFGSSLSSELTFDPTYFAGKTDYPDLLQTLIVNRHEILLLGSLKTECWYDAGNALFPFAELPGAYIEHGIAAKYSIASQDISVYWLGQDLQGHGVVFRYRGYTTARISNHAVEFAIREMASSVGISDAIGYTYQQDGHVFYVIQFPAGNQTWVFDESIGNPDDGWHQEAWTNPTDGSLNRHRGNCAAFINGINVVGDFESGTIYKMDLDAYTDTVNGRAGPITCVRTFPHIGAGVGPTGQMIEYDGHRMMVTAFAADFEAGNSDLAFPSQEISLRWSTDRGRTFGNYVLQEAGAQGDYLVQPIWRDLGISRDPVFEISHSINGPAALNGAWIDVKVLGT